MRLGAHQHPPPCHLAAAVQSAHTPGRPPTSPSLSSSSSCTISPHTWAPLSNSMSSGSNCSQPTHLGTHVPLLVLQQQTYKIPLWEAHRKADHHRAPDVVDGVLEGGVRHGDLTRHLVLRARAAPAPCSATTPSFYCFLHNTPHTLACVP